jgi:4-amino-4-deoxy-L-arabinose transferase-like glycosyltransferase
MNRSALKPLVLASGSAFLAFALMANQRHVYGGVVLGALACIVSTVALLQCLGGFDAVEGMRVLDASPRLGRSVAVTIVAFAGFVIVTRWAVAGTLPGGVITAAVGIPGLLLLALAGLYRTLADLGVFGCETAPWRHPSFWLIALTIGLYAPMLGSFSLIDPWETHYGEVAREILSRDDWISLWWAQDGWFWSKPVLDFWAQALSYSLFDVKYAPDAMLSAVQLGRHPYPEWAARLPMLLFSLVGQVLLYAGVKKTWGRGPAWLGSVLLIAVPHYAIIVHQSMTDLPYIATLTGAMGLLLLGLSTRPEALATGYAVDLGGKRRVVSAYSLVMGAIIVLALPQILYLLSRNVGLATSSSDWGFFAQPDRFFSGSGGGNCGIAGNEPCALQQPVNARPQPALSAALWALLLGVFIWTNGGERRRQRLQFLGAWLLVALSFMAKGLPGPIIFVGTLLAAAVMLRRVGDFERFEIPGGFLVFASVALPWFVQMTVRHGPPFLERLFIHDMYKRAFVHVHDTNAGDDTSIRYYLWQLGYGLFPATGVIAMTSLGACFGRGEHRDRAQATGAVLAAWFLVGFAMFSLTLTKFHHYVIAVVPPLCLLTGRFLQGTLNGRAPLGSQPSLPPTQARPWSVLDAPATRWFVVIASALIVGWVGVDLFTQGGANGPVRLINLVTYNYSRPWPKTLSMDSTLFGFTLASIASLFAWLAPRRWRWLGTVAFLATSLLFCAWVCDSYLPSIAPHWGQRETIVEYYLRRRSPDELLVSFQMNWKGENFYTGNRTPVFITTGEPFKHFIAEQRAANRAVLFFTLEHARIGNLKNDLGAVKRVEVVTDTRLNNKFALVRVEL